jgi:hypothetical protein
MEIDLQIPDSRICREAEELLWTCSPAFLGNHCVRSYAWSVALAARDQIRFDAEMLYIAALLHDLGLVARFDTGRCFEEDGATAAADFATNAGWSVERSEAVGEAIRLHVAVDIALKDGPEAHLLWHATGLDVTGHRHDELEPQFVAGVVAAYPRLDFKHGFVDLLADQAARKPRCWAAAAVEGGVGERIARAPFAS